ncbi:MAG: hypothetical protein LBE91_09290 [Tannerella sp.]|jgi:uncharacterized protein YaiE (UPF0345 family)|nr:hypothetical protein [Tannerella sp.]
MNKILKIIAMIGAPVLLLGACTKNIDREIASNECSLLDLKITGQMGTIVIDRYEDDAAATVYILQRGDYPYGQVAVEGIVVSSGATASVQSGGTLDFQNPERRAKITVTAESGKSLDWWISLEPYDAFYVGTWKIDDIKIHCDQRISNSGDGSWDTQISGNEFGAATEEYDNRIIVTLDDEMNGNNLTGTIINDAGADGKWSNFRIVIGFYSPDNYLDMNPRLRYLLPPGQSQWSLNLTTNEMKITQNNITSTMKFRVNTWGGWDFVFPLPDATGEPWTNNEFSNMWRSSTELFYSVTKISN